GGGGGGGRVRVVVRGGAERRADRRLHAENGKEARGAVRDRQLLGRAVAGQREPRVDQAGHIFERRRAFAPSQIVGGRDDVRPPRAARVPFPDGDEPLWILVRQPFDERGIDNSEDRCVRANAERQRHYRNDGKAGTAETQTNRVADILKNRVHVEVRTRGSTLWLTARPAGSPTTRIENACSPPSRRCRRPA